MAMIQVTIGTNTNRKKVIVDSALTPKRVLTDNEIAYETANIHLDGSSLSASEMNSTFDDLGITDSCFIIAVIKADNA